MEKSHRVKTFLATWMLFSAGAALAWDGSTTGVIQNSDVTDGPAYAFRIELQGSPGLCGTGGASWAYVNSDNPNYRTYVALLLSAQASGAPVQVFTTRDAATGYCKMGYVRMFR